MRERIGAGLDESLILSIAFDFLFGENLIRSTSIDLFR